MSVICQQLIFLNVLLQIQQTNSTFQNNKVLKLLESNYYCSLAKIKISHLSCNKNAFESYILGKIREKNNSNTNTLSNKNTYDQRELSVYMSKNK